MGGCCQQKEEGNLNLDERNDAKSARIERVPSAFNRIQ